MGFNDVALVPVYKANGWRYNFTISDLPLLQQEYRRLFRAFAKDLITKGHSADLMAKYWLEVVTSSTKKKMACGAGCSYLGVASQGKYYLCHRFYDMPEFAMGHVDTGYDKTLAEQIYCHDVDENPHCSDCWAKYYCGGMCYHDAQLTNGHFDVPVESQCEFKKMRMLTAMEAVKDFASRGEGDILNEYLAARGYWRFMQSVVPKRVDDVFLTKMNNKTPALHVQ